MTIQKKIPCYLFSTDGLSAILEIAECSFQVLILIKSIKIKETISQILSRPKMFIAVKADGYNSAVPPDLEKSIKEQQMADLKAYLRQDK